MNNNKKTDINLVKRLLSYTKPYWFYFLIALILLVGITALELLNPYLLKVAIDNYITIDQRVVYEFNIDENLGEIEKIDFNNKQYVLERNIKDLDKSIDSYNYQEKVISKEGNKYYIKSSTGNDSLQIDKDTFGKLRRFDSKGIKNIAFIFLAVITIGFIIGYIQMYILNATGQKIIYNIRNEVFSHIQSLSLNFFDNSAVGRLVTRVNNDIETLNEMYTSVLVSLFKDLFTLVGIIIIMTKMDYKLALFSFSFLPIFLIISIVFRKKIRVYYEEYRKQLSKVNASLNENISGMTTIQIFNKEEKIAKSFDEINTKYHASVTNQIKVHAMLRPAIEIVRSLAVAILIYFGGGKVISNNMEFGTLYVFIDYLQRFFQPIFELTEKYNVLQSSIVSSERIFEILDNDNIIENTKNPIEIKNVEGHIEFKNVWFAYEKDNWILKNVSFNIKPGQSVAFVGPTGAGKTTIINLITRFYDIQKGEILLDGIDIKEIDKHVLRQYVGVVLQDVFMFSGTIEDNIKLLTPDIDRNRVIEVAEYVNADTFINKLPHKYDEPVMERGSTLSSGERQLLSFARTLAHNPRVLVLDEATANIDTETELLIQDALSKLIQGRTSIAIAHRLSTIQHADRIIVLNNGMIEEEGTHQELLNIKGLYYNLYEIQEKENN